MEDLKNFKTENGNLFENSQDSGYSETLSDEVYSLFTNLIYSTSGIKLNAQKKSLLVSRLTKRLIKYGIKTFYDYYRTVKENNEELIHMLNSISTNTTKFFRENYHFVYLRNAVIPELIKNKADEKVVRIWSAGCSTGEEPYSIAITIYEAFRENMVNADKWDIRILATDISTKVLDSAQAGIYEHEQLPEDIDSEVVSRYFFKGVGENEGKIKVKNSLKEAVRFRRLNLKDETYPFKNSFDAIFCRNVMIYFDDGMRHHVVSGFYEHLIQNGYLFLGHSETMFGREQFIPVHVTVYRKN